MNIVEYIMSIPVEVFHTFGYLIFFILILAEGIPPIGVLSPGQFVLLFGGFLAKTGVIDLEILILIGTIGSISGDLIGYYIGKKIGLPFLKKYGKYVFIEESLLEKVQKMMDNHFFKTVFLGKFYGWTRVLIPFVCGVSNISLKKYYLVAFLSGISWSIFWGLIGYIFAQSFEFAGAYIGKILLGGLLFGIFIIFAYRYINKKKHIFTKNYIFTLIINVLSVLILSKIAQDVSGQKTIVNIDNLINFKIESIVSPLMDQMMFFVNNVGNIYVGIVLSILLSIFLIYKKKKYYSRLFSLGIFGGFILEFLLKLFIGRLRPENALIFLQDYSFPSGHTTMATVFFLTIRIIYKNKFDKIWKQTILFVILFIPIVLIGFSRIYLNVHRFSDVVSGFFLGVFWITFMILILKFIMENKPDKNQINIP